MVRGCSHPLGEKEMPVAQKGTVAVQAARGGWVPVPLASGADGSAERVGYRRVEK